MTTVNTPIDKETCAEILRQRVLSMELEPGVPLDEVALAKELGVSRTPLREIIQRLSGEGYLVLEKNRGAKVASMDLATLNNFFQAAPMIYAAISRLAAERADKTGIESLKAIQVKYRQALNDDDLTNTVLHNHRFHKTIGLLAETPYLMCSLDRLLIDHARIGQTFYRPSSITSRERIKTAADQHDQLIDALERAEAADAVEATLQHWELSRHMMERFVRPDPLPFDLGKAANEV